MNGKLQKHNIDNAFVIVLFAVFAVTIVAVLALGANSYKSLVERDNEAYNKRIITSYISAKIRNYDAYAAIEVTDSYDEEKQDGMNTLHLYEMIEGQLFEQKIYFYDGYIYEMFTVAGNNIEPEAGNPIMEAKALNFKKEDSVIRITSVDVDGRENAATVALRCESGVTP